MDNPDIFTFSLEDILKEKDLAERWHFLKDGTTFVPAHHLNEEDTRTLKSTMTFFSDSYPEDTWLRAWWLVNEFVRRRREGWDIAWVRDGTTVEVAEYEILEGSDVV